MGNLYITLFIKCLYAKNASQVLTCAPSKNDPAWNIYIQPDFSMSHDCASCANRLVSLECFQCLSQRETKATQSVNTSGLINRYPLTLSFSRVQNRTVKAILGEVIRRRVINSGRTLQNTTISKAPPTARQHIRHRRNHTLVGALRRDCFSSVIVRACINAGHEIFSPGRINVGDVRVVELRGGREVRVAVECVDLA